MKDKRQSPTPTLSASELQLIEQLRRYPELFERFRGILEITTSAERTVQQADEVEALLIEAIRRLGHSSMESWAARAEQTLADQLRQKDASARVRKKKPSVGGACSDR